LDRYPPAQVITLPEGSWGQGGHHWVWLNDKTVWTWQLVYEAETRMIDLARRLRGVEDELLKRLLLACARQLLLIESSDWQFVITALHAADYAEARITRHFSDFKRLAALAEKRAAGKLLDPDALDFLKRIEQRDPLFKDIDLSWWAELEVPIDEREAG